MSCILCKGSGGIFNIHTIYGNANHNVRDDLIEILGLDVESYLCPSDCVCNICMTMLQNVTKLKWKLWQILAHENEDYRIPINQNKIWQLFATLIRKENDTDDDGVSCRTPTPSNLVVLSHSRDYNPSLEEQIQIKERNRSLSSGVGRSVSSEAKEKGTPKKRRRRGRSHWTHRKSHATSPATSEFTNRTFPLHRRRRRKNDTPLSDRSYLDYYSVDPEDSSREKFDESGTYNRTITRRLSRGKEQAMRYHENLETRKLYCVEKNCTLYVEDLDVFNYHQILHHGKMALYYCEECGKRYTTAEHLKLHKRIHEVGPFWCLLCFIEVKNQDTLQKHLEEHASYSVPCKYCDMSFLSKNLCENHIKSAHAGRKERIIYRKKIIMDRIDKDEVVSKPVQKHDIEYQSVISIQTSTPVECDDEELDVTTENLRLKNIDFATIGECDSDSSELIESETPSKSIEAS